MKQFIILIALCICIVIIISNCSKEAISKSGKNANEKSIKLTTRTDSISYVIGNDIAKSLSNIKNDINIDILISGIKDQIAEKPLLVNENDAHRIISDFSREMRKKQQEKKDALAKDNLEKGKKFLEENKKKDGVITTASGLQYIVLQKGSGPQPTTTDNVKVHYKGTTIDGKEFDSSYSRGEPAVFPVNGVIKGWTEALLLMNVGSKYKLFIPPELGYGQRGAGEDIGPNEVLIFEVELLNIEK